MPAQSAFTGQATLSDQTHSNLDKLLNQANAYSEFLLEQIAEIEGKYSALGQPSTTNGRADSKRKAQPAAKGRGKRRKGAAAEPEAGEDQQVGALTAAAALSTACMASSAAQPVRSCPPLAVWRRPWAALSGVGGCVGWNDASSSSSSSSSSSESQLRLP